MGKKGWMVVQFIGSLNNLNNGEIEVSSSLSEAAWPYPVKHFHESLNIMEHIGHVNQICG